MNSKSSALSEINALLSPSELDRQQIKLKLKLFENEIQELLNKISVSSNFYDCETDFKRLDDYQLTGAKLFFKYDFEISNRLEMFIRDFDRIDDLETRRNLYDTIKGGKYF